MKRFSARLRTDRRLRSASKSVGKALTASRSSWYDFSSSSTRSSTLFIDSGSTDIDALALMSPAPANPHAPPHSFKAQAIAPRLPPPPPERSHSLPSMPLRTSYVALCRTMPRYRTYQPPFHHAVDAHDTAKTARGRKQQAAGQRRFRHSAPQLALASAASPSLPPSLPFGPARPSPTTPTHHTPPKSPWLAYQRPSGTSGCTPARSSHASLPLGTTLSPPPASGRFSLI